MAGSLVLTKPDDSALDDISLVAQRSIPSDHVALQLKNTGDADVEGANIVLYAEQSAGSGVYVTSGQAAVDERQGRFQITDQDSTATPGQEIVLGEVQPLGHLAVGLLPTIKPGDWILADFWLEQAGSSAGGGSINLKLEIANETAAYPLPRGMSSVGTGIDSGRGQMRSFPVSGRLTAPTGSPDDYVHVAPGSWLINGDDYADVTTQDIQLDQNDGASNPLGVGQSYIAIITQGTAATPTATKGIGDASPVRPTPPAGELILAFVNVSYTGATSVIGSGDITADLTYGRYFVEAPATGLSVIVHKGEAIIANFAQVRTIKAAVLLGASATSYIWLEWSGEITVTTTPARPSAGALLLALATTNSTDITACTDARAYIVTAQTGGETVTLVNATSNNDVPLLSAAQVDVVTLVGVTSAADFTGIVSRGIGQLVTLVNGVAFPITVKHLTASASGNQIRCPAATDVVLAGVGDTVTLLEDVRHGVWRVIAKTV